MLSATGLGSIEVYRRPIAALIAVGNEFRGCDEDYPAAEPSGAQSRYPHGSPGDDVGRSGTEACSPASNLVALASWCRNNGIHPLLRVAGDMIGEITRILEQSLETADAIITIGGTGEGPRDIVLRALAELHWDPMFKGVKLLPGRTTSFGLLKRRPVFALPGAPVANETAFLLIALPGLKRLAGSIEPPLFDVPVQITWEDPRSPERSRFTEALRIRITRGGPWLLARPLSKARARGRLAALAGAHGIILLGPGDPGVSRGEVRHALVLDPRWAGGPASANQPPEA
ncbi:MAG: hypothetical protein DRH56_08685 [Deltaproteobacteria bacterium]|nr:MAG: hypothetical protein DRH56_08685 [Deltaproteobacteria bacterium]